MSGSVFEMKARDAGGRIGKWKIAKYEVTTPNIAVVVNPHNQIIPAREMKKYGAEIIITNAYIIRNSENREKIEKQGIRKFYGWGGPVYTDSGTFQMYSQGAAQISPQETIAFQKKIGSDIITPLDVFTLPNDPKDVAEQKMRETFRRIRQACELARDRAFCAPVQGGNFPELRVKAAREVSSLNPDVFAIGGIVPLMEQYRFRELADAILSARAALDPSRPVHAFGCGHPMLFSLIAAMGVDVFDSAAYAIFAKQGRYLTSRGTEQVRELHELPCSCQVCSANSARELQADMKLVAGHNLHATFGEIRAIRQAIYDGCLYELVEQRIRAHPALIDGYLALKKHSEFLEKSEPVSRRHAFFYTGAESEIRPAVFRAKTRVRMLRSGRNTFKWLGIGVPSALKSVYPFGQSVFPYHARATKSSVEPAPSVAKYCIAYQYGARLSDAGRAINRACEFEVSKSTGRLCRISRKGQLLGTFRDYDGYFVPTFSGAEVLMKAIGKKLWVKAKKDAGPFILRGLSLFAKFVADADGNIRPGDEVFVVDSRGILLATGTALMNRKEMLSFKCGIAVKIRHAEG